MVKIEVRISEPHWDIEEAIYELYQKLLVFYDVELHIVHGFGGNSE